MKARTLGRIFLFILLIPSLAQAYTETFYVCRGGDGSQPESANCATAWDEADFNSSGNWANGDSNDGRIGPNDIVYLMDDGGPYTTRLVVQSSGTPGNVITISPQDGDSVAFDPARGTLTTAVGDRFIFESDKGKRIRVFVSGLGRVRLCSPSGSTTYVSSYPTC